MPAVAAARRTAHLFVDGLGGRADIAQTLSPAARSWAPHLGWADGSEAVTLLRWLGEDLAIGQLEVDAVVAAADVAVVEAVLALPSGEQAPVTASLQLD